MSSLNGSTDPTTPPASTNPEPSSPALPSRRGFLGFLCGATAAAGLSGYTEVSQKLLIPEKSTILNESELVVADTPDVELALEKWVKQTGKVDWASQHVFFGADQKKLDQMPPTEYQAFLHDHMEVNRRYKVTTSLQSLFAEWWGHQLKSCKF